MHRLLLVIFFVISCPRYGLKKLPEKICIDTARQVYKQDPLYAYTLLKNINSPTYNQEKAKLLLKIYLNQREYERAAALLDSMPEINDLNPFQKNMLLLKTQRWQKLLTTTQDSLIKAIAYYRLNDYDRALNFFNPGSELNDYCILYQARCYYELKNFDKVLEVLFLKDTDTDYLQNDYRSIILETLLEIDDLNIIKNMAGRLKKKSLEEYVLLRTYEKKGWRRKAKKIGRSLIKRYPKSPGAYYALSLLKAHTRDDYKSFGKVCYYHNDYERAVKYLKKAKKDSEVNYYLGKIYYCKKNYNKALKYFTRSKRPSAYYYRGRIYEDMALYQKAIDIYDSLKLLYPQNTFTIRGQKRKAFLLEDIGDTLQAVATFLDLNEKNTKFRAAMQLYRIGSLQKALEILEEYDTPDFLYWRIRIKERLGEPTDSLKEYLHSEYPFSYYTLLKEKHSIPVDTIPIEIWIASLGDTTVSFSRSDSLHLKRALRYFELNELQYGEKELDKIEPKNGAELLYLSRLCAEYGVDRRSVIYALRLKRMADKQGKKRIPVELLNLLYPVRYAITIYEEKSEISLCLAMIWQESLFDPDAVSPAQAQGLMQIIPQTATLISQDLGIDDYTLFNPCVSIKFGWHYFSKLMEEFNSIPLSLAGYNAGPIRVRRWLAENNNSETDQFIELIPYNETRNYVKSVLKREVIYRAILNRD